MNDNPETPIENVENPVENVENPPIHTAREQELEEENNNLKARIADLERVNQELFMRNPGVKEETKKSYDERVSETMQAFCGGRYDARYLTIKE